MKTPYLVGISGGSGSGKTYFIDKLVEKLPSKDVCQISQDNYYKNINDVPVDKNGIKNFDLMEAVDFDAFLRDIELLKQGEKVQLKEYTFNNHSKTSKVITLHPAPIILVEGIFTFSHQAFQNFFDLKLFIEATDIIKIKRRIFRDAVERGYEMEDVLYRYEHHVEPAYRNLIAPFKDFADVIIPNSNDMSISVNLVSCYLKSKIKV